MNLHATEQHIPWKSEKKISIIDQRRLEEEALTREIQVEFMHPRWAEIWAREFPPRFDKLSVTPILAKLIEQNAILSRGRCLVPGCGRGYDAIAIASENRYCIGVDIVQTAIELAKERLEEECAMYLKLDLMPKPPLGKCEFKCQNFFELDADHPENLFDFAFDSHFLCALDPRIRQDWAVQMARLIKIGGELMTIIFPIMEKTGGPPFPLSIDVVRDLLMPVGFEPFELYVLPPEFCHPGRGGSGEPGDNSPRSALGRWRRIQRDVGYDHEFDA